MKSNIKFLIDWKWMCIIAWMYLIMNSTQAAVPDNIDYQGYLTDTGGSPVSGTVSVTFNLYNVDTGGVALWSDTQSVTPDNGLFNVKLGSAGNPFPIGLFDTPLYIGIDVAGDGEMSPRIAMSSSGFSHKAADADSVGGISAGSLATSTELAAHSGDTTNPHAVTAAQTGAPTSASFTLHTSDPAAHHSKTTSFTELTDTATDAQIPDNITVNQAANADTLDGLDSTAFMSSSADNWVNVTGDTMTGNLGVLGSIGIGTVSPASRLHIEDGVSDYVARFHNQSSSSGNAYGIYATGNAYSTGTGVGRAGYFYGRGGSTSGSAYGTFNLARAYGTSPAYGVYSDATSGSTAGREWAFYGIGDSYFSGDVGIGTNAPVNKLDVIGNASIIGKVGIGTDSPGSNLSVAGGTTIGSAYATNVVSDGSLAVSSNLGVGVLPSAYKLDVRDGINTYLAYFDNNNDASGSTYGLRVRSDGYDTGVGVASAAYFSSIGGSTSGSAYGLQSYAYAYGGSSAYGIYSYATLGSTTGREWAFYGIGDGYFSGDVGIGTSNPAYQLHIVDNRPADYVAKFDNNSTSAGVDGIKIELGPLLNPGPISYFVSFYDAATLVGGINSNGVGGVSYYSVSDERLKTDIVDFTGGLDLVNRINVKQYEFKKTPGFKQVGFLAQQLQKVFPDAVSGSPESNVEKEPMSVDYGRITPMLVSAIQEQTRIINELKTRISQLEAKQVE